MRESNKALTVNFMMETLRDILDREGVTELCINRPGEVFAEIDGRWEVFGKPEVTLAWLRRFGTAAATFANNDFEETAPILSATLPTGERAQFVMPPACRDGTLSVTIRRPAKEVKGMEAYLEEGFLDSVRGAWERAPVLSGLTETLNDARIARGREAAALYADFLSKAVALGANVVVAGGTGSGKTTFMKTLMQAIPASDRILTIEDVPELLYGLPNHANQVNLLYPSEGGERAVVTASTLMRSALRMRPDRILLAELRGGETLDFLNVCLSGHKGSVTSCHAGSAAEVYECLALKVLQSEAGRRLPWDVVERLLHLVIDVVVHIENDHGRRRVTEILFEPEKCFSRRNR